MTEAFQIKYPDTRTGKTAWSKQFGLNAIYAGKHWTQRRQDAQMWHILTTNAMNRSGCRRSPFEHPVVIRFHWNDNMDIGNHAYMAKMIEDGMKGRIIADDGRKHVAGWEHFFHCEPFILVEVREVQT